jgi:hypothetical protein
MSIYNIDFNQIAIELAPPDKRRPKFIKWLQSLLSQNTWLHTKIFIDYKTGADYPSYDPLGSYSQGDRVIYSETVYESLVNSNTATPDDATAWRVYQNSFIGTNERITYNHIKLSLEYALNRRFQTDFNQPPLISEIYIETNSKGITPFISAGSDDNSSVVFFDYSSEVIINSNTLGVDFFNFTVFVPLSVYNATSANPAARENIFRNFIDRYNTIGLFYNIQTY